MKILFWIAVPFAFVFALIGFIVGFVICSAIEGYKIADKFLETKF